MKNVEPTLGKIRVSKHDKREEKEKKEEGGSVVMQLKKWQERVLVGSNYI